MGLPLPNPVLADALDVGDNGVEWDRRMLPRIEGGAELEAAMVVVVRGFGGVQGYEDQDYYS